MTKENENILEEIKKQAKKQFGSGAVMVMSEHKAAENVKIISTGNAAINELTGIGGIVRGRITEIYGPEGGGKTTFCLHLAAEAQKLGGEVLYIDAEHSLNIDLARAIGVNVDQIMISQPESGEEGLELAEMFIRSKAVMLVIVDSVAALVPRAELDGEMGDPQMGLQARLMSQAMRKLRGATRTTDTALVFINQVRDKIGQTWGNTETTSGGRALKFYASLRLDIRRISQIKKGDVVVGQNVKVKSVKNKLSAPYRTADVELLYGQGFVNE